MNITLKGVVKTVIIGGLAYSAGKLATIGKVVMACKDRPEDVKEAINGMCNAWSTLKEQAETEATEEAEEETAPEIVQVTSAEDKETPEDQPED